MADQDAPAGEVIVSTHFVETCSSLASDIGDVLRCRVLFTAGYVTAFMVEGSDTSALDAVLDANCLPDRAIGDLPDTDGFIAAFGHMRVNGEVVLLTKFGSWLSPSQLDSIRALLTLRCAPWRWDRAN